MGQITLTAKIQIYPDDEQKELLIRTRKAYTDGLNFVSDIVYNNHNLCENDLSRELYPTLRGRFGLKSQQSQSVIKRVLASYKTIQSQEQGWIRPSFKKDQYELVWGRDVDFYKGKLISVNTINRRVKVPYCIKGYEQYFDDPRYKLGTAKLIIKHGRFFLHVPVSYETEECNPENAMVRVGCDLGINNIITTYDSNGKSAFVSGGYIKHMRRHYSRLRQELQKKHTVSAHRKLKSIGQRESRWMNDINHCISKRLVMSYPEGTLFVLEDLNGIGSSMSRVNRKHRYISCSWSFADLSQKIEYKAKKNRSAVVYVDPRYTSQKCPACGHIEKDNRIRKEHIFRCKCCGYSSNDDRVGAINILLSLGKDQFRNGRVPEAITAG